jgi:hypothetical protein
MIVSRMLSYMLRHARTLLLPASLLSEKSILYLACHTSSIVYPGTEEIEYCRRAFLQPIQTRNTRLLRQSCLSEERRPSFKETLMYLPTLFFTLSPYTLNVWTRIARKAPDMIETVQYIFLAIASHTYGSVQYILFISILYLLGDHILSILAKI